MVFANPHRHKAFIFSLNPYAAKPSIYPQTFDFWVEITYGLSIFLRISNNHKQTLVILPCSSLAMINWRTIVEAFGFLKLFIQKIYFNRNLNIKDLNAI